jgi:hypothetical protein
MSTWIHELPIGWMAMLVFGATYAVAAALHGIAQRLARSERGRAARAITPALLSPLGITFGLLVVFTAGQVWGDADRARSAVNQEASALRTAVLLAGTFPDASAQRLRSLVAKHIEEARTVEWPAMAQGQATLTTIPGALAEALQVTVGLEPSGPGQVVAQREILTALTNALEARRTRILVSRAQVNGIKWSGIILQALCSLAAIALVHADNRSASAVAMGLFGTAAAVCVMLLLSHDAPFTGSISVSPAPLLEVRPN